MRTRIFIMLFRECRLRKKKAPPQNRGEGMIRGTTLITAFAVSQAPLTRADAPVIPGRLGSGHRFWKQGLSAGGPSLRNPAPILSVIASCDIDFNKKEFYQIIPICQVLSWGYNRIK